MGNGLSNKTLYCEPDSAGHQYWASFDASPFAKGASRYAYRGILHGTGPRNGRQCVVKVAMNEYMNQVRSWSDDKQCAAVAIDYAQRWNKFCQTNRPIYYQMPLIAKIDKRAAQVYLTENGVVQATHPDAMAKIGSEEYVVIEEYLDGDYQKWNSNYGWVGADLTSAPAAFSHFTYWASGGTLMVVDIQGVRRASCYQLTDPAIHSANGPGRFGITDHGIDGMKKFFGTHRCNDLCRNIPMYLPGELAPVHLRQMAGTVYRAALVVGVGGAYGGQVQCAQQ